MPFDLNDTPIDLKSLTYQTSPKSLEHITCPICKLPFINPWSTICGHTFCKECIMESMKSTLREKCPLDRVTLRLSKAVRQQLGMSETGDDESEGDDTDDDDDDDYDDIYPAPIILSNITDDLMVSCLNAERGCCWIGERWSIKNHLMLKCEYTRIECTCGILCQRKVLMESGMLKKNESGEFVLSDDDSNKKKVEMDADVDVDAYGGNFSDDEVDNNHSFHIYCPHREIDCVECGMNVQIMDMKHHLENECLENMAKCTGCHLSIPLMHMEKHKSNCQKIFMDCLGWKYGCTWKGQREILESVHLQDCPFFKISGYLEKLEDKISKVNEENANLKLQMSSILDSVVHGRIKNLGYSFELEEINTNQPNVQPIPEINSQMVDGPPLFNNGRFNATKARYLLSELEAHNVITKAVLEENINIREQMNNQRAMILSLQQQMQFMMIERRRMTVQSSKSETKLNTKL